MEYEERWTSLSSPLRPLKSQIDAYFPIKAPPFALILGCTPEIRDACYRRNSSVTVMDIDKDSYIALASFCEEPCHERERYLQHDWLEYMPALENQYDLVISDVPYMFLDGKESIAFTKNVYRYVKAGGWFAFRQVFYSRVMFESLVGELASGKIKFTREAGSFLLMTMLCDSTNKQSQIDLRAVRSNIGLIKSAFSSDLYDKISFHLSEYSDSGRPEIFDELIMPKAVYRDEFIRTMLEESGFLCRIKSVPYTLSRHCLDYKLYYCRKPG